MFKKNCCCFSGRCRIRQIILAAYRKSLNYRKKMRCPLLNISSLSLWHLHESNAKKTVLFTIFKIENGWFVSMPEELTFGYSGGHTAESEKNMVRETIISCKWNTICICRKNMEYFPSTVCRWILLFMIVIYSDQQQWNANGHVHAWTGPSPSTIFNFILYFDFFFFCCRFIQNSHRSKASENNVLARVLIWN